jgi:hypothetical protein
VRVIVSTDLAQWDMAMHPKTLDLVEDILGPNFVMWGSHFFCKQPHDNKPVPKHQVTPHPPTHRARRRHTSPYHASIVFHMARPCHTDYAVY